MFPTQETQAAVLSQIQALMLLALLRILMSRMGAVQPMPLGDFHDSERVFLICFQI